MHSNEIKYNDNDINNNNKENTTLKEILSPMVLEVMGKKYTDIYIKRLGDKYYELIDNLIDKKKFHSPSYSNTKINSGDESILNKNKISDNKYTKNKENFNSIYWKDYDFVNNTLIDKKLNNFNNKDNSYFVNMVQISKNNQTNEEEQSESIIIKNKNEENETDELLD